MAPHCLSQGTGGHFLLALPRACHSCQGAKGLRTPRSLQAGSSGLDPLWRRCPTCQPPCLLAWIIAMAPLVSLLPLSTPLVSSPGSIQSDPNPDHVPLLRNLHGSPLPGVKVRESYRIPRGLSLLGLCVLTSYSSHPPSPSATPASSPFLQHARCMLASGPLHWLCPLPGLLSPDMHVTHPLISLRSLLFTQPKMPTTSHSHPLSSPCLSFSPNHISCLNVVHIYHNYYLFLSIKM